MSLYRTASGIWRSPLLDSESWVDHAFGTAQASPSFPCLLLKQVHGKRVVDAASHYSGCEGDALVSADPYRYVAVKTADCLPLLLADAEHRVVAAVHSGWRGTQAGIAAAVVKHLASRHGVRPENLVGAVGPCIRNCCFEVGPEVATLFRELFPERDDLSQRTHIDLVESTRRQVFSCGVDPEKIEWDGPCTVCGGQEFYSWRRDHIAGARMYSGLGAVS